MATVFTIDGKHFVSGLMWRSLGSPRKYMAEARRIGREEGMDVVAIRHAGEQVQAGFVRRVDGALQGQYSIAAALSDCAELGAIWIGAFSLHDDRYVVVGVENGAIIPTTDAVCSREDAEDKLRQLYGMFEDAAVIAPLDFGMGGKPHVLEELLAPNRLKSSHRLKSLSFSLRGNMPIVALVAAAAIGAGGYFFWYVPMQEQKAREAALESAAKEEQQRAAMAAMQKQSAAPVTAEALTHPWAQLANPGALAEQCKQVIGPLPALIKGWRFASADCEQNAAAVTYVRTDGGVEPRQLLDKASEIGLVGGHISDAMDVFSVPVGLKVLLAGDEALPRLDDVLLEFHAQAAKHALKPTITPSRKPSEGGTYTVTPWELTLDKRPVEAMQALVLPGSRLRSLQVAMNEQGKLTWTMKGELYANP